MISLAYLLKLSVLAHLILPENEVTIFVCHSTDLLLIRSLCIRYRIIYLCTNLLVANMLGTIIILMLTHWGKESV